MGAEVKLNNQIYLLAVLDVVRVENPLPSGTAAEQFLRAAELVADEVSDRAVVLSGALHPGPAQLLRDGGDGTGLHPGDQEHLGGHLDWTSKQ